MYVDACVSFIYFFVSLSVSYLCLSAYPPLLSRFFLCYSSPFASFSISPFYPFPLRPSPLPPSVLPLISLLFMLFPVFLLFPHFPSPRFIYVLFVLHLCLPHLSHFSHCSSVNVLSCLSPICPNFHPFPSSSLVIHLPHPPRPLLSLLPVPLPSPLIFVHISIPSLPPL